MINRLWDKLGEYLAVYLAATLLGFVLRRMILKIHGWRKARRAARVGPDGRREPDAGKS